MFSICWFIAWRAGGSTANLALALAFTVVFLNDTCLVLIREDFTKLGFDRSTPVSQVLRSYMKDARAKMRSRAKWLVGLLGFEPRTKGFTFIEAFPPRVDYLFTLSS